MNGNGTLSKLKDLAVSETGFVFDPHTGATFTTNACGVVILRGLQEGKSRPELIARLEAGFDVAESDLHRDLDEFIQILRDNGVVPKAFLLDYGADSPVRAAQSGAGEGHLAGAGAGLGANSNHKE